ncbi:MAG TPA: heparin lyase I family protein [Stenomitos sp.]
MNYSPNQIDSKNQYSANNLRNTPKTLAQKTMLKSLNSNNRTIKIFLCSTIGILLCLSCQNSVDARLIQYIDFETGNLSQFGNNIISQYDGLSDISVVKYRQRAGRYAARCYFGKGQDRVEITTANGNSTDGQYGLNNQINWYGWSMWIPGRISKDQWTILSQWHYHTPGSIVDSLKTLSGSGNSPTRLSLWPQGILKFSLFHQVGLTQKTEEEYELGKNLIQYNSWNDFVMQVKWTSSTDGFVNFWVNGKQVLSLQNTSTYFGNPYGPRFKAGVYKGAGYQYQGEPFNVYIDEYRHADQDSSYAEVLPGSQSKIAKRSHRINSSSNIRSQNLKPRKPRLYSHQ